MHLLRAATALCIATSGVAQIFADATPGSGLAFLGPGRLALGSGMTVGDFDGDGDQDLVVPGNRGEAIHYLRNDGGMTFSPQAAGLGVAQDVRACRAADIDNDGDLDLWIGNWRARAQLFVNDGTGRFTEEASARGITHVASNFGVDFGDYDRDGWLDIIIGNRFRPNLAGLPEPSILYRNTGNGYFVDVTATAGVGHAGAATFSGLFFDFDEDGWPDIFFINDKGASYEPNNVFRNNGDGTFAPHGHIVNVADAMDAMGMDFVDVFNDGGVDFYCSDSPTDHLFRVWDPVSSTYTNETLTFGLAGGLLGWATHFVDIDNDGWQDLHVVHETGPNHLYLNPATPRAAAVPWSEAGDPLAPATDQVVAVTADFDEDGRVDILHRMMTYAGPNPSNVGLILHRNVTPLRNWLKVRTLGTASNRDGIGARVEVRASGITQRQYVRCGVGFIGGNDLRCHFGLGAATTADVTVRWPSGHVQRLRGVAVNRTLTVVEPSLELVGTPAVGSSCALDLDAPDDAGRHYAIMLAGRDSPATPLPGGGSLPIAIDGLTALSLSPGNPLLQGGIGRLQLGHGSAQLTIPNLGSAVGLRIWATAVTYDATGFGTSFGAAVPIDIR